MNESLIDTIHQVIDPFDEEIWVDEDNNELTVSSTIGNWASYYEIYNYDVYVENIGYSGASSGTKTTKGGNEKPHEKSLRKYYDKSFQSKGRTSKNFVKNYRKICHRHK